MLTNTTQRNTEETVDVKMQYRKIFLTLAGRTVPSHCYLLFTSATDSNYQSTPTSYLKKIVSYTTNTILMKLARYSFESKLMLWEACIILLQKLSVSAIKHFI